MLVYRYRLSAPDPKTAALVRQELAHAYAYRRTLARIENARRMAVRVAVHMGVGGPALADAEQLARDAAERLAVASAGAEALPGEGTAAARDEAKAAFVRALDALSELRRRAEACREGRAVMAEIKRLHAIEMSAAYNTERSSDDAAPWIRVRQCSWGTAALVKRAHEQACQSEDRRRLYDGLHHVNLWVPDDDGTGALRVQLQGGASLAQLASGEDTRVRIERRTRTPHNGARLVRFGRNAGRRVADVRAEMRASVAARAVERGEPRRTDRPSRRTDRDVRTLRLRVTSEGRAPVFASWAMNYARPIAADAQVKEVVVRLRRDVAGEHWSVSFVCEQVAERDCGRGRVALDIGWRKVPGGLRIAHAVSDDGASREYVLPKEILDRFRYAEEVRGTRDQAFNRAMSAVLKLRRTDMCPEWFVEATSSAHSWRSHDKLVSLVSAWTSKRFDGDAEVFDELEWWGAGPRDAHWTPGLRGWVEQDRHLHRIEFGVRRRAERRRRDLYRVWAVELADRYDVAVFEDVDLSEIARRYPGDQADAPQSNRVLASVSDFVLSVRQCFRRRGGCGSALVEAADSTHTCADCRHLESFDAREWVSWTCSACGAIHDQDENAARVLLGREHWCDAKSTARVRVKSKSCICHEKRESHFARIKRLAAEKRAREAGPREAGDGAAE